MNLPKVSVPSRPLVDFLMRVRPAQFGDLLKTFLGIARVEIVALTNCRYWIDPVSNLGVALARWGIYEEPLTRLLQALLHEGDTFVDLGANEGYFSVLAGTLIGKGRVFAIEPQSRLQKVLKRNLELNNLRNVQVEPLAIADIEGDVDLLLRPSTNSGASGLIRHWRFGRAHERVPATTLDRFFSDRRINRVRLLKVDCEGAETFVFRKADAVLAGNIIEYIVLDFHPAIIGDDACRQIDGTIRRHGYRLAKLNGLSVYHSAEVVPPPSAALSG
jgi:FkbM family methyltransferase